MSLVPFWMRYVRNALQRDPVFRALQEPFNALTHDPFFRDAEKILDKFERSVGSHLGIEGIHSPNEVKVDGQKVELTLDVTNFSPEQIQVKTVGNEILIEGKKELQREGGWTRSHFERRFTLPEEYPPERVECHLDHGKLKLIAFRAQPLPERNVPIQDSSKPQIES